VSIRSTGLCGSDLHYYNHGRNGNFVVRAPLVLGHESSGVVTAVGSDSSTLKPGDRVALEVGMPCRSCAVCTSGRYNICPSLLFKSSAKVFPHIDGTLTQLMNHPANLCHTIPDSVTFEEGALVEPLSVSLHAVNRSEGGTPLPGSSALVVGAGAIGLLTACALSVSGVSTIVIADIDGPRLEIAENMPFNIKTHLIPKSAPASTIDETLANAQDLASTISKAHSTLSGFSRVFECTGVESCVQTSIYAAAPGGKLVLVGMGRPVQTLPLSAAALREVDIIGVFRYANTYPAAIRLFASGKLKGVAEALVTHKVSLEDGETAFRLAAKGIDDRGKAVVKVMVENKAP